MKHDETSAPIHSWAFGRLSSTVRLALDRLSRSDDVCHIAVMPDVHPGTDVCIGTVFATTDLVYPDAVGGDIGCGMAAVALDAWHCDLPRGGGQALLRRLRTAVPIQRQRVERAAELAEVLPDPGGLTDPKLAATAQKDGAMCLGTLGRGNHFLELQRDDTQQLWLMVHSGSRALGQAIRAAHAPNAQRGGHGLRYLDARHETGAAYLHDMHWGRSFARTNRRVMLESAARAAAELFGWQWIESSYFDCDHNHINVEPHFGRTMLVHRKGAMAVESGVAGIVPGSMAAPSFHVTGRGVPEALNSSAHGAGRAMSRTEARKRIRRDQLQRELRDVVFDPGTLGGLREEAPSAYKDVRAVMKAQRKLIRVRRTLQPILTCKGVGR